MADSESDLSHAPRERVDQALVARGLARSRALAREYVKAGRVLRDGVPVRKPSEAVATDASLEVSGEVDPWVGRAAYKLLAVVEAFRPYLDAAERRCLDIGASTGGFTQVLLAQGASEVTALDVGHGQLAQVLRDDPRVVERSGTSIRDVGAQDLGGPFDMVVVDLSFISLRLVMDRVAQCVTATGDVIVLVKPQFEVGRAALSKTGVVTSAVQRVQVVQDVVESARAQGLYPHGLLHSPVRGTTGNVEYLLWLAPRTDGMMSTMDLTTALDPAGR
ncbi:TlyA family RNA methyltransferase [Demetria terragena]|uniref:TlyA family RNA methyltransferase n=1 Tax=Demetria terragena TaxID=63959 RepID=UPI00037CC8E2|nr:TlyA family RNA methyltransferase [Demetria terragena]